jgi:hypothetical protein
MQHVSFVVNASIEKTLNEPYVDPLQDFGHARMNRDRTRGRLRTLETIHGAKLDAVARELEREHRAGRTGTDNQDRDITRTHIEAAS